jgi:UDP-3-O-[3-hydroxymyristoyl] N-acetylglucosamine deacetylase/3-hydroxyacyl-[acyl-carrier-protein] dehydratase
MTRHQRTIEKPVTLSGRGLHTGQETVVTLKPAGVNTGWVFVRTDLPESPRIRVGPDHAHYDPNQGRRTILKKDDVEVHSMEHLLASVLGLGVDNLIMEVNGLEVPEPGDGSALAFARAIREAGIVDQGFARNHVKITKPVTHRMGDAELLAVPTNGLRVSFTIDYDNPVVGTQYLSLEMDDGVFENEIAPARTFVLERDIKPLRAQGLIKGGSLESAVVVGEDKILNQEPLRFPDEFVRHKILDLLGDLALLGAPLLGHVISIRSGHASHVAFVRKLAKEIPQGGRLPGSAPTQWDASAIMELMPHRYPFILLDRILELEEGKRVVGLKNVTINEHFFTGHFPGHPIMPAVLILEAMAQAGGVLLMSALDDPSSYLAYFVAIDKARFRQPVRPGDQLRFELTMIKHKGRICRMRAEATVDGQPVAEAELTSAIVDR